MEKGQPIRLVLLALVVVACGTSRGGRGGTDENVEPDSAMTLPDARVQPQGDSGIGEPDGSISSCAACGAGQVCDDGHCVDVPKNCPCPAESYCDLATDTCVVGCFDDDGCSSGRICENDKCQDGCRADEECGAGQICEDLLCRAGCREHDQCGEGQICENTTLRCREGCLYHSDCPLAQICGEQLTCVPGCTADEYCPEGTICGEQELCRAGCRTAGDCDSDEVCDQQSFSCLPFASSSYCNTDYDCSGSADGNKCDLSTRTCTYSPRNLCDSSKKCGDGQWCNPNSFSCYNYNCGGGSCGSGFECKYDSGAASYPWYCACTGARCSLSAACTTDADCPYSARCQDSACVPYFRLECEDDADCPTSSVCLAAVGKCGRV